MKTLLCIATLVCATAAFALQDAPDMSDMGGMTLPTHTPEHEWLQQLVGEWDVVAEASMGHDAPPMEMRSTESVRSIGGLWITGESNASLGGMEVASILTLGYDPDRKAFVGSWIDSMHTTFWTYVGELDESKKVLTLTAEGPSFSDPTKTATYHDAIEIVDADHKVLTSSVQNDDGTWTEFLRAQYTRKK